MWKPRKVEVEGGGEEGGRTGLAHGETRVKVGEHEVVLTQLDKVYWPEEGYTKGDLVAYYRDVADLMLPYLRDRPLILKRYPKGIARGSFHQHEMRDAPPYVRTVPLESEAGRVIDYAVCDNAATLLYLVNLGSIALHPWHSRVGNLDQPDWVVFDLDQEGANYDVVCKVALALKEVLDRLGLEAYPKTSGSSGMHLYLPIGARYGYDVAAEVAEEIAMVVARENPDLITLERSLVNRKAGRVYLDYLQNARGKSIVAPYSVRARPRASVSAPLDWGEVKRGLQPSTFTMPTMRRRLETKGDLFSPVLGPGQSLEAARTELDRLLRGRRRSHEALA